MKIEEKDRIIRNDIINKLTEFNNGVTADRISRIENALSYASTSKVTDYHVFIGEKMQAVVDKMCEINNQNLEDDAFDAYVDLLLEMVINYKVQGVKVKDKKFKALASSWDLELELLNQKMQLEVETDQLMKKILAGSIKNIEANMKVNNQLLRSMDIMSVDKQIINTYSGSIKDMRKQLKERRKERMKAALLLIEQKELLSYLTDDIIVEEDK